MKICGNRYRIRNIWRSFQLILLFYAAMQGAFGQEAIEMKCSGERSFALAQAGTYLRHPLLEQYDVTHYLIDLAVSDTGTYIEGSACITAMVTGNGTDSLVFELSDRLWVDSLKVNNSVQDSFIHQDELLIVPLTTEMPGGEQFVLCVYYHGAPVGTGFLAGLANKKDPVWNIPVTYTLSESFHLKDWLPCKQVLTDKADSATIIITVPPGRMAGSNGMLSEVSVLDDGWLRYTWICRHPIAYYLLSLTVAEYMDYSIYSPSPDGMDSVLIQNFIYADSLYLEENRDIIDLTADMVHLLSQLYLEYPFSDEKYGHCVAPIGGGMEHQTMTTLAGFSFDLVSHELGHQWFGDHVTCATWQDIWINEGFASYTEYLCREFLTSREEADQWMSYAHQLALTEPDGSIFIPLEDAEDEYRIFSYALSYKKGASIIHMLRHELGDDSVFFRTLGNFLSVHGEGTASGLDFKKVLEETSGRDFSWFFDQWYFGKGYPVFNLIWWQTADSLTIHSIQTGSSAYTDFFRTKLDFRVVFNDGGDTLLTIDQTLPEQYFRYSFDRLVDNVFPDPMNWLLEKSTITRKLPELYVSINPNPFSDQILMEFQNGNSRRLIMISDLNGKIYWQGTTESTTVKIPTSELRQGLYMISVHDEKDTYSAKIIKH